MSEQKSKPATSHGAASHGQSNPLAASVGGEGKQKRRIRNFLLQPLLQIKVGLYSIILSFLFSISVVGILYYHLGNFASVVLQLTDAEEEVVELLRDYLSGAWWGLIAATSVFLLANIIISVIYTHRLVGPTYAFRRHIRRLSEGRFETRTYLRKSDAFTEVADELNRLSEVLEEKEKSK